MQRRAWAEGCVRLKRAGIHQLPNPVTQDASCWARAKQQSSSLAVKAMVSEYHNTNLSSLDAIPWRDMY
jgi:hypothetical protein